MKKILKKLQKIIRKIGKFPGLTSLIYSWRALICSKFICLNFICLNLMGLNTDQLMFIPTKKEAYIGEKISFVVRFISSRGSNINFRGIESAKNSNINFNFLEKPYIYKQTHNKRSYNIIDYYGVCYSKVAGEINLEGFRAYYTVAEPYKTNSNLIVFNNKKIFSNPVQLKILDLPKTSMKIHGIGKFSDFKATLSTDAINSGDGAILTLSVQGNGNFEDIRPLVPNLPKEIKAYNPKVSIENFKYTKGVKKNINIKTKKFEYPLQGITAGNFKIPEQEFNYFDTEEKVYKTLKTSSTNLKINPQIISDISTDNTNNSIDTQKSKTNKLNRINGILENYKEPFKIPWQLFFILFMFPVLLLFLQYILNLVKIYRSTTKVFSQKSIYSFKTKVNKARKSKNMTQISTLYSEFKEFLCVYLLGKKYNTKTKSMTDDKIVNLLNRFNFDNSIINSFKTLNNELLEYTYYSPESLKNIENIKNIEKTLSNLDSFLDMLKNYFTKINTNIKTNAKNTKAFVLILLFFSFNFIFCSSNRSNSLNKKNFKQELIQKIVNLSKINKYANLNQKKENIKLIDYLKKSLRSKKNTRTYNSIKNSVKNNINSSFLDNFLSLFNFIPIAIWQILFITFWWLTFIFYKLKKIKSIFIALIFLLVPLSIILSTVAYNDYETKAIIISDNSNLYVGPGNFYPLKFSLNQFDNVKVLKKTDSWYYIELLNQPDFLQQAETYTEKLTGWIDSKSIEII